MDLVDLNPGPVLTRVGEVIFKLRLFDLNAVVWAESFFSKSDRGGLNAMFYILDNPDNWRVFSYSVADIAFYLAEDLEIKTLEEFKKKINEKTEDSNPEKAIAILSESIKEVKKKSFPEELKAEISGGEIFQNSVGKEKHEATNWARIYSYLYRFGGMTIDQFYALTIRQISEIYSQINESRTREEVQSMQFNCAIHGVKKKDWPKMPARKESKTEIDSDEIKRRQDEHAKLFKDDKWPSQ